jgi:hypothetical protein
MRKVKALSPKSFYSYKTSSLVKHLNKIVGKDLYFSVGELAYVNSKYACTPTDRIAIMGKILRVYGVIDDDHFLEWDTSEYLAKIANSLLAR